MKIFLSDVDDCMLDWTSGFAEFMQIVHPTVNVKSCDYSLGMSREVADSYALQYNNSEYFARMKPFAEAEKYVPLIAALGYKFVVVTSCLGSDQTAIMREENLLNVFGDIFDQVICIPLHTNKQPVLEKFNPTFWVDDKLENCAGGAFVGHTSLLMNTGHNQSDELPEQIKRVYSWKEIYQLVKNQ